MSFLGLSQAELARRVGVAQPTIFQLIHRSKKGSTKLHLIARELGTTPAYLMGETDDPEADAPPAPEFEQDEVSLVEKWRLLTPGDQKALLQVLDRMIAPRTVHTPALGYRAQDSR